jgi:hypothetical protein
MRYVVSKTGLLEGLSKTEKGGASEKEKGTGAGSEGAFVRMIEILF